jgi:hypothetical protein
MISAELAWLLIGIVAFLLWLCERPKKKSKAYPL